MERKTVAVILSFSILAGIMAGATTGGSHIDLSGEIGIDCLYDCSSPHKPVHGTGWFFNKSEGPLYIANKPGVSGWADNYGTPPFYVRINSKGLRDSPMNLEKPSNTTRVLVIGDSYTFGTGVNRTDIFTEVTEKKLGEKFPRRNIQVINGGIVNAGMKDYYLFLKHRGLNYNPDIVVIGFIGNDQVSASKRDQLLNKTRRSLDLNRSEEINSSQVALIKESYQESLASYNEKTPIHNSSFRFIDNIQNLADSKSITAVYYGLDDISPEQRSYLENRSERYGKDILYAPSQFRESDEELRISKWDRHPNPKGHRIIAERLSERLETIIAGDS
jgi:lysophospholipase L1-like esterase